MTPLLVGGFLLASAEPVPVEPVEELKVVVTPSCKGSVQENIYFPRGAAEPLPESAPIIEEIIEVLKLHPEVRLVEVAGHADQNEGTGAETLALSQQRAELVVALLVAGGVDAGRLTAKGYGEHTPLREGSDPLNQRVDMRILTRGE